MANRKKDISSPMSEPFQANRSYDNAKRQAINDRGGSTQQKSSGEDSFTSDGYNPNDRAKGGEFDARKKMMENVSRSLGTQFGSQYLKNLQEGVSATLGLNQAAKETDEALNQPLTRENLMKAGEVASRFDMRDTKKVLQHGADSIEALKNIDPEMAEKVMKQLNLTEQGRTAFNQMEDRDYGSSLGILSKGKNIAGAISAQDSNIASAQFKIGEQLKNTSFNKFTQWSKFSSKDISGMKSDLAGIQHGYELEATAALGIKGAPSEAQAKKITDYASAQLSNDTRYQELSKQIGTEEAAVRKSNKIKTGLQVAGAAGATFSDVNNAFQKHFGRGFGFRGKRFGRGG
jgi:hypothetical protein